MGEIPGELGTPPLRKYHNPRLPQPSRCIKGPDAQVPASISESYHSNGPMVQGTAQFQEWRIKVGKLVNLIKFAYYSRNDGPIICIIMKTLRFYGVGLLGFSDNERLEDEFSEENFQYDGYIPIS